MIAARVGWPKSAALWLACLIAGQATVANSASADVSAAKVVAPGSTWAVARTIRLNDLRIGAGATVAAPAGKSLSLTVNGVETGIAPGSYHGALVLTVGDQYAVEFAGMGGAGSRTHLFRQALFLDQAGVTGSRSVTAAAGPYTYANGVLRGAKVKSVGENFNGIVAAGGRQTVVGADLDLRGNGGNDFAGFGAALLSVGKDTTLIVDGAHVHTQGAIRTGAVADKSSHLIVKNSVIAVREGTLPSDYVTNVTPGEMKDAPWMLGIRGNARATNLLGDGTTATYINSDISSEGWGVLSVDNGSNTKLTAINSKISNTGSDGYGSYAIGNSRNAFYGTLFDVKDYAQIITGGDVEYGASSAATLARLNKSLGLGLTAAELSMLGVKQTRVFSERFGVMWHGSGSVTVRDATRFETGKTLFLIKGATASIDVDGAGGASLQPGNGVLVQVMDNDDPGPGNEHGLMVNNGVFHEPTAPPARVADFDLAAAHDTDVKVRFANISLDGDLYNGARSGPRGGGMPGGPPPAGPGGTNLLVTLEQASLAGVVSSTSVRHAGDTIGAVEYKQLGEVTNAAAPGINNGVQLTLQHSTWTVHGTSYLNALRYDADSALNAPEGTQLSLSVNGAPTPLQPGEYRGQLVLSLTRR